MATANNLLSLKSEVFAIPLQSIMDTECFAVLEVAPIYAYADGKRTDTVTGTRYLVANPDSFINFEVRVSNPTPVIAQEKIEASKDRFYVSFANALVIPAEMGFGKTLCKVTADSAKLETGN